ncbi:hypothetical protein [Dactylosporangium sp. NPDC050588]|uniref:hypothetical protein n=1 Tax=Dactylosporangium sp. NPDC050588 TaxID=3157211 RepID=UPI0033FEF1C2
MRKVVIAVSGVVATCLMVVGVAACAAKTGGEQAGGPVTPSPVPITVNPSALPVGDTVPTGVVIKGKEMVLYFWGAPERPYLDQAWRDTGTGEVRVDTICAGGTGYMAEWGPVEPGRVFGLMQCVTPDGTLVELGAVWAEATRVTSQAEGKTVEAKYAKWSRNPAVTIFWVQRHGKPIPQNVPAGEGRTTPLPEDRYPLITAYDGKGATIVAVRLRPPATEQKGG